MTAPRLDVDLVAITHNTRTLVARLAPRGIRVTGISKAALGSPGVAAAMLRGGASGIGDARMENVARLRAGGTDATVMLIRSPMLSQVDDVVRDTDLSLNTEASVLDALSAAAVGRRTTHDVVLMVELGDLREGVPVDEVVDLAVTAARRPGLRLVGLGTNLACRSGVVPDQTKMDELTGLVEKVEGAVGDRLTVVTGGNSANLDWALATSDVGRIDDLRLGESILLGTEPLHRRPIDGLRTDAFTLVAELIEVKTKPAQPWGARGQTAFGHEPERDVRPGLVRQAIAAIGRQDVDPDGLVAPPGMVVLAASSDHLVIDVGDHDVTVGDEVAFGLGYGALVRAMTSPFVTKQESVSRTTPPIPRPRSAPRRPAVGR
ncbi:alanine/ornithine racemase family PLP-dependent enzyme [Mumia zhuanghuii]|uniref:Alanine/ornithine racemase family PLP-dependent enzyme n=2 Tax=Mumia TaxID=1546255 RepID=A0ABW1QLA3_9ACTN|nr:MULTISPECIES: alanine/ornithine racemase family PLP-dependent enzyme [Mumia]KAA1425019.1 alanine/ornithine racemase family PLP-dependent enzyme [Mumia zhuanghuii]